MGSAIVGPSRCQVKWLFADTALLGQADDCSAMRPLPRWRQIPSLFRLLVISFGAIDVTVLAVASAGLRSWFHGGATVAQSLVYLLLLAPFFVHVPPRESLPRNQRFSGSARIVAGVAILALSGWIVIGVVDEFLRRVEMPDYILEGIVFTTFLTAMGSLLVWRGWQRQRGMAWATFPPPTSLPRHRNYGEKRNDLATVIAFFVLGSAVLFSFNFYGRTIAFQPSGWLVTPAGFVAAAAILIVNRRLMRRARTCFGCGQHVPLGATVCPSCSRPFT